MKSGRDEAGRFAPNNLGGRPRGSTGMSAAALRDSLLRAFDRLGGEEWLMEIAEKNPVAVLRMLAQVLPRRIEATVEPSGPRYDPRSLQHLSDAELIEMANAGLMTQALVPPEGEELLPPAEKEMERA